MPSPTHRTTRAGHRRRRSPSLLALARAPSAAAEDQHTVRPGETLSRRSPLGTTRRSRALAEANGLGDANRIIVGQVLVIPAAGAPAAPATVVHVVAPGETLGGIAAPLRHDGPGARRRPTASRTRTSCGIGAAGSRCPPAAAAGGGGGTAAAAATHTVAAGETLACHRPPLRRRPSVPSSPPTASRTRTSSASASVLTIPRRHRRCRRQRRRPAPTPRPGQRRPHRGRRHPRRAAGRDPPGHRPPLRRRPPRRSPPPTASSRPATSTPAPVSSSSAPNRLPSDIAACPVPGRDLRQRLGLPPLRRPGPRGHRPLRPPGHAGRSRRSPAPCPTPPAPIGGHQFRLARRRRHRSTSAATWTPSAPAGRVAAGDVDRLRRRLRQRRRRPPPPPLRGPPRRRRRR